MTRWTSHACLLCRERPPSAGVRRQGPARITARGTGGTWEVAVGEGPSDPVFIGIVTDAVGFCRLVANWVTPADLDLLVTGDPRRAAGVLAAALALD
jgi:hypothetical protein